MGLIWVRPGAPLEPLLPGAQSRGLRAGTENLLGITALSFAAEDLNPSQFISKTEALRSRLEQGLQALPVKIWGESSPRIPNTTRLSFDGFTGDENWVELLDLRGFAVSHGSACKSQVIEPSRVLLKMGASNGEALNAIRVSTGPTTEPKDIDDFLIAIQDILSEKGGRS